MQWAIRLGEKGRTSAPPNPWVGCVIVKEGEIVGEGYHEAPGKPHAEKIALQKSGPLAKGATAYVSLEPCPHQGRTPPCTDALIAAGIKRVCVPLLDPDPHVSGKGIKQLKEAGVEVVVGLGKEEAERSLRPYLHQRRLLRPFCVMKTAMSIDGRTAAQDGSSQWITGVAARKNGHQLRAESQAIMVGSATALHDLPRLDVRGIEVAVQPKRVLIDWQGKVSPTGPLADLTIAKTVLFTLSKSHKESWEGAGAEAHLLEKRELKTVLEILGKEGILQLLVEGGSRLHSALMAEQLIDQMVVYMGNCLLGDSGKPLLSNFVVPSIVKAPRWFLEGVYRFDNDVRLDFLPARHLSK